MFGHIPVFLCVGGSIDLAAARLESPHKDQEMGGMQNSAFAIEMISPTVKFIYVFHDEIRERPSDNFKFPAAPLLQSVR